MRNRDMGMASKHGIELVVFGRGWSTTRDLACGFNTWCGSHLPQRGSAHVHVSVAGAVTSRREWPGPNMGGAVNKQGRTRGGAYDDAQNWRSTDCLLSAFFSSLLPLHLLLLSLIPTYENPPGHY